MARASSVYAVFNTGKPVIGFTVRHELITYLKRQLPEYLDLLTVYKLPDGVDQTYTFGPSEVDIVSLLK